MRHSACKYKVLASTMPQRKWLQRTKKCQFLYREWWHLSPWPCMVAIFSWEFAELHRKLSCSTRCLGWQHLVLRWLSACMGPDLPWVTELDREVLGEMAFDQNDPWTTSVDHRVGDWAGLGSVDSDGVGWRLSWTASMGDHLPGVTEMPWTVCSVVGNYSSSGRNGHWEVPEYL